VTQLIGVGAILVWVSITSLIMFGLIKAIIGLRVSEEEELAGLDVLEHGSPGYGEGFGSFTVAGIDLSRDGEEVLTTESV
jgi:Amt family ammonium transporter